MSTEGYVLRGDQTQSYLNNTLGDRNLMEEKEDSGKKMDEKNEDRANGNLTLFSEKSLLMDVTTSSKHHRVKRSVAILSFTQADKDSILGDHNLFRSYVNPQASNMNKLVSLASRTTTPGTTTPRTTTPGTTTPGTTTPGTTTPGTTTPGTTTPRTTTPGTTTP